jgi:hypothetical protein
MNTATTTKTYFYQSAIVNYVEVDLNNPLHKELYEMFEAPHPKFPKSPLSVASENIKQATKLMKKIPGFKPSQSLNNTIAWSTDLFIFKKDK